ncbi:MAG: sulfite exporter TauE/SafE family protein [Caldilineaceae bacterium]
MAAKRTKPALRASRALTLALLLVVIGAASALAHPLGNFTINRYSKVTIGQDAAHLLYILDMAEIPTYQEMSAIDRNGDGEADSAEQTDYLTEAAQRLAGNLALTLNGQKIVWQVNDSRFTFAPGQGGLDTLRLEFHYAALLPADTVGDAAFADNNFPGKLGWQEVVVVAEESRNLLSSSVPGQDISQELRAYPQELLQSPPRINRATFQIGGAALAGRAERGVVQAGLPVTAPSTTSTDPFAELINLPISGPGALLLALLAAFVWGGAHALSPGHGKTIVAAYLVGSRGTARHALFLGLTTTLTHTAGVFILGLITLFASRYILPETLFPWLGVLSGLLVVGIGASMIWQRLRPASAEAHSHHSHSHEHPHAHPHAHTHDDNHSHSHDDTVHTHGGHSFDRLTPSHSHLPPGSDGTPITWRGLLALGVSGGLLPCPSALVVMLGAIALQRVAFGLLLIVVFSFGLASVLALIGILMVHAGKLLKYVPESGRFLRLAPVASALFITLAGGGITAQALLKTGLLGL